MSYESFQHLARLHVLGKLEPEEHEQFIEGRRRYGAQAEAFLEECRRLSVALALSLEPIPPAPETKRKLLERLRDCPKQPTPPARPPLAPQTAFRAGRH